MARNDLKPYKITAGELRELCGKCQNVELSRAENFKVARYLAGIEDMDDSVQLVCDKRDILPLKAALDRGHSPGNPPGGHPSYPVFGKQEDVQTGDMGD